MKEYLIAEMNVGVEVVARGDGKGLEYVALFNKLEHAEIFLKALGLKQTSPGFKEISDKKDFMGRPFRVEVVILGIWA